MSKEKVGVFGQRGKWKEVGRYFSRGRCSYFAVSHCGFISGANGNWLQGYVFIR